ncbi:hypothetical protein J2755_000812 [Methanohalophilus levihalophilus]|uniref:hypothetical protein n=1 Tax=Methanohalophilus levihalophilus TaxID=1431282 RepID=UPI001AE3C53D|nr:hypothetical protein [Methanohalophilus levihalophilus]MBP2029878.1 hypothetical protein [Methanohalophilus levihalophilus]
MKSKIIALLLSFTLVMLAISGCTDPNAGEDETGEMTVSDMVVLEEIPAGFEYLGARELSADKVLDGCCNESHFVEAHQGIYESEEFDVLITVIEASSENEAENLVNTYKATFPPMTMGNRFIEQSINNHFVTRIVWYVTENGADAERYAYVWNSDNFVFHIRGATSDPSTLKEFAEATGY